MSKLYSALIIDDEAPAREGLQNLLKEFSESIQILDIEMPGCTGFELLAKLKVIPIVVFCTAYDEYALEAFETNSIDYLVKPIRLERIEKTIQKLKSFENNISSDEILNVLKKIADKKDIPKMTSITVKKDSKLFFIKLDDIPFFESDETITNLTEKLPDNFLRIHRGIIINKKYVNDIQKYFNSRFIITLNDKKKTSLTSVRNYNDVIKNWIS
jgi:DNA-binding LytR/AlgR family response regulator